MFAIGRDVDRIDDGRVRSGAAVDRVELAVARVDRVGTLAAEQRVGALAGVEPVVARRAVERVGAVASGELVVTVGAEDVLDIGSNVVSFTGRAVVGDSVQPDGDRPLVGVGGVPARRPRARRVLSACAIGGVSTTGQRMREMRKILSVDGEGDAAQAREVPFARAPEDP